MGHLTIGIDSSTTSCKAIAWDREEQAVAEGRASYSLLQPEPNWYEQDAEAWWDSTCAALRILLSQVGAAQTDALCITNRRESFVPVDGQGRPHAFLIHRLTGALRASLASAAQAMTSTAAGSRPIRKLKPSTTACMPRSTTRRSRPSSRCSTASPSQRRIRARPTPAPF